MLETARKETSASSNIFSRSFRKISKGPKGDIFEKIKMTFANKDIRNRVLFTLFAILIFRLLSSIPLPGIDPEAFKNFFSGTPFSNIFTIVTGGRLDNPSIVAIGLASYINASIVIQLLTTVIPSWEEMQKEGERERQKLNQYTRILTIPLTILQAFVIYSILKNTSSISSLIANTTTLDVITMIASLTAGTVLLMWISELISESGIGNGSSVIIMTGILSVLPSFLIQDFDVLKGNLDFALQGKIEALLSKEMLVIYLIFGTLIALLFVIVFMTEATRKITVQYARRVRSGATGLQNTFLPIKLNQAGVMPVIFASSILIVPQILSQFILSSVKSGRLFDIATAVNNSFLSDYSSFGHNALYLVGIMAFSFFYTFVVLNPSNTADNLKKSGGFIPGIRPGTSTIQYLTSVTIRLTVVGSIFLAAVALAPSLINTFVSGQLGALSAKSLTIFSGIGGTSLLILVGVILDTRRQIQSMSVTRSYEHYKQ